MEPTGNATIIDDGTAVTGFLDPYSGSDAPLQMSDFLRQINTDNNRGAVFAPLDLPATEYVEILTLEDAEEKMRFLGEEISNIELQLGDENRRAYSDPEEYSRWRNRAKKAWTCKKREYADLKNYVKNTRRTNPNAGYADQFGHVTTSGLLTHIIDRVRPLEKVYGLANELMFALERQEQAAQSGNAPTMDMSVTAAMGTLRDALREIDVETAVTGELPS